jgi:hypothetical protein
MSDIEPPIIVHLLKCKVIWHLARAASSWPRDAFSASMTPGTLNQPYALRLVDANQELDAFSYSVRMTFERLYFIVSGFTRTLVAKHSSQLGPEAQEPLKLIQDGSQKMDLMDRGTAQLGPFGSPLGCFEDDAIEFARRGRSQGP